MTIRKAVITAAGWGTRFLPATKSQPKETIPLVDKPIIQYIIEEAVASGITQIVIVTAGGKRAIEDHFDRSFELEMVLERKGDLKNLHEIRRVSELADICYVRQKQQLGLGHAILAARSVVGDEPFAVFLPDDIIEWHVPAMKQMVDVYEQVKQSVVAVEKIAREELSRYGIIDPQPVSDRVYRVKNLVEKPAPEDAPSELAIVGRYILTPEIFDMLAHTPPGRGGEIQLTDGLKQLLSRQEIYAYQFEGTRYDTGNPLGFLIASVEYALKHQEIGSSFRSYLEKLVRD